MTAYQAADPQTTSRAGGWSIIRSGLALSPAITEGLWLTLTLATIGTAGSALVPVVVQQAIDGGLSDPAGVDTTAILSWVGLAFLIMAIAAVAGYWSKVRIYTSTERGLTDLRVKAFRHVHDLSMLTQNTQRRGSLVSRVTSDVDQVSLFLQFTGMIMITSVGQMLVATVVMAILSWQLTLVVLVSFLPLALSLRFLAEKMSLAYDKVRATVGEMLSTIAEPVVGASVVRSYAIARRTQRRIDASIEANYDANVRAQRIVASTFGSAILVGGIANAGVLGIGIWLGVVGDLTMGTVVAFIFLVGLFVGPAQMATQVITDAQNAIASWRRVIDLLHTPADVVDPGTAEHLLPPGELSARFESVQFAYPGSPKVLADLSVHIGPGQRIAVVGETGSGKTTFAKLLTRLMDTTEGRVLIGGADIRNVSFAELRSRVVMVPQEGFLFDATIAENFTYGRPAATEKEMSTAVAELELSDWFATLPNGLQTMVGQRGESLSAGERQLVALIRAALADPSLLVLDEATSAVDPQTELRTTRALEKLLAGRTSVTIAHRLSTAENADRVLVFDAGRLVEDGTHAELVTQGGVYSRLHASWVAQAALS